MGRFYFIRPLYLLYGGMFLGLICGIAAAFFAGETLYSTMRMALCCHVSIIGLSATLFLPVLLSAIAVFLRNAGLLILIAFAKTFCFCCVLSSLFFTVHNSGASQILLLLFSDWFIMPILSWFWLRYIEGAPRALFRCTCISLLLAAAIGCVDYLLISPMLAFG